MAPHIIGAASSAAMEVAPLAHQIILPMRGNSTASIITYNSSGRKETTASLRVILRRVKSLRSQLLSKLLPNHNFQVDFLICSILCVNRINFLTLLLVFDPITICGTGVFLVRFECA